MEQGIHSTTAETTMMEGGSTGPAALYKATLDQTLKELDNAKREVEEALKDVCSGTSILT